MRAAIIGMGAMGKKHYQTVMNSSRVELVGVVDTDPQNLHNLQAPTYTNIDDLLEHENLDLAIVATPTTSHFKIATKLINKNIHLFVEKPIAQNLADAKKMDFLARKKNCKAVVGHVERFNPAIQAVLPELLQQEVVYCSATRMSPYPQRITDVGVKLDLGIHDIDLLRLLTQKGIKRCLQCAHTTRGPHEDTATFMIEFEDGTMATAATSWLFPFRERQIKILTKTCYYELDLLNLSASKFMLLDNNTHLTRRLFVRRTDALSSQLEAFVGYIQTDDKGALCTFGDAALALKYINVERKI